MDCLCYHERGKTKEKTKKEPLIELEKYWKRIEEISSPKLDADGQNIDIECNYILCDKCVKSGSEKNVLLNNIHYTFCSEDCWDSWLSSGQNLRHCAKSIPIIPLMFI